MQQSFRREVIPTSRVVLQTPLPTLQALVLQQGVQWELCRYQTMPPRSRQRQLLLWEPYPVTPKRTLSYIPILGLLLPACNIAHPLITSLFWPRFSPLLRESWQISLNWTGTLSLCLALEEGCLLAPFSRWRFKIALLMILNEHWCITCLPTALWDKPKSAVWNQLDHTTQPKKCQTMIILAP